MNEFNNLINEAKKYVGEFKLSLDWMTAGYVAAAIKSASGKIYTGICIDVASGIGFCAEHSAIAQMLKERETKIEMVMAINQNDKIMPPCGRCREFMLLINKENEQTKVLVSENQIVNLIDLLPYR